MIQSFTRSYKDNMNNQLMKRVRRVILCLEMAIGLIIAVAVILGIPDLFRYIYTVATETREISYQAFGDFLKHVLMLVVGLEMLMMILTHSHESILTLVLFVIARKMLVYADSMFDIFIGTISIGVIFFVLRFFGRDDKLLAKYDNTFSAAIPVEKVRREFGFKLPETSAKTLGGLIYELSIEKDLKIEKDLMLTYGDYKFTIVAYDDGVIERILIEEKAK